MCVNKGLIGDQCFELSMWSIALSSEQYVERSAESRFVNDLGSRNRRGECRVNETGPEKKNGRTMREALLSVMSQSILPRG